ncbi:hypothetical protein SMSKK35_0702 [Stenotrophomonas maltophilia SKK35]|nr:hypothetical protein SMSKK35_0702 [Stenotrophomonas maltophilia SKK35]
MTRAGQIVPPARPFRARKGSAGRWPAAHGIAGRAWSPASARHYLTGTS